MGKGKLCWQMEGGMMDSGKGIE